MTRRIPPLLIVLLVAWLAATGAMGRAHELHAAWDARSLSTPSFPAQLQDLQGLTRALATRPIGDGPGRESSPTLDFHAGLSRANIASTGSATIRRDASVSLAAANRFSHFATGPPEHR